MGVREKKFVNIKDIDIEEEVYRVTFSCPRIDYEDAINRIENYAEIIKEEIERYEDE